MLPFLIYLMGKTMRIPKATTSPRFASTYSTRRPLLLSLIILAHIISITYLAAFSVKPTMKEANRQPQAETRMLQIVMLQRPHKQIVDISTPSLSLPSVQHLSSKKYAPTNKTTTDTKFNATREQAQNGNPSSTKERPIDHHIAEITQMLEREIAQDERKQEAAKAPNQLVREYWEKQNHPYQNKWQELSAKIEKAAVARGPQEESYTLDDGSRITKINGVCYKAPDPGRAYLAQAEVRRVFCPRN